MEVAHQDYLASLDLPPLALDVYASPELEDKKQLKSLTELAEKIWPHFMTVASEESVFDILGLKPEQTWEIELNFVTNPAIHNLNREYRDKDQATDVLTFTLLADADEKGAWTQLPVVQLGSIFISIDWAQDAIKTDAVTDSLERYLMERFVHGLLHLMGLHHDTMSAYHRVVAIQKRVLDAVF